MTTIVNSPGNGEGSGAVGVVIGILLALVIGILFYMYILPSMRGDKAPAEQDSVNVNIELPAGESTQ